MGRGMNDKLWMAMGRGMDDNGWMTTMIYIFMDY